MQVSGNPGSDSFKLNHSREMIQMKPVCSRSNENGRQRDKPPPQPDGRKNSKSDSGRTRARFGASDSHLKTIIPRREVRVIDVSQVAGGTPILIDAFQFV